MGLKHPKVRPEDEYRSVIHVPFPSEGDQANLYGEQLEQARRREGLTDDPADMPVVNKRPFKNLR